MNMIPISGFIDHAHEPGHKKMVDGFAFQVPGFEFIKTWATPAQDSFFDSWVVSHWESGLTIGTFSGVSGLTPQMAAERVVAFLQEKGVERVKARLAEKGFTV
jgi:hypothetical protein